MGIIELGILNLFFIEFGGQLIEGFFETVWDSYNFTLKLLFFLYPIFQNLDLKSMFSLFFSKLLDISSMPMNLFIFLIYFNRPEHLIFL